MEFLTDEVGPLFVVIDEIGDPFDKPEPDDIKRRDRFMTFSKLMLARLLKVTNLFFMIVGRTSFMNHVGLTPTNAQGMTSSPLSDSASISFGQKIIENTENGLQGLIGTADPTCPGHKDRMKKRWRLLVENLQPVLLQKQIQRLIDFERRVCRTDDVALNALILRAREGVTPFLQSVQGQRSRLQRKVGSGSDASDGNDPEASIPQVGQDFVGQAKQWRSCAYGCPCS
ncbi:hypothetical protein PI124_g2665 [Phytophthora idaei]|nr:hypothetical protein PI125_g8154 [Phytophthora idaei]KAG3158232.1 hypothetical protein PI126_g7950 [Phytophthora idaei]KAG3252741.1 hypothetical protein PI124_g2665 [Phytophthora idaei]